MPEKQVKIELVIPQTIYQKAIEKAKEAGFNDINEFLIFVLEQLLEPENVGEEFTEEDEEKVKERLRALGYID